MAILEFQNVTYQSGDKVILKNISFLVEEHDFISVVGASGSGKSTLLKLCSHLISPTNGSIMYNNQNFNEYNPTELRKSLAYCFQTPYLFGNTVMDNIKYPFHIRDIKFDRKRVDDLFSLFQMTTDYLEKDVRILSGGEKQRIALIRSLIFKPEVLLVDEVTSALDLDNTTIVENVITSLNKEGMAILWITHNPEQSKKHANKLMTMEAGEIKSMEVIK